jgi:hypothetical protein
MKGLATELSPLSTPEDYAGTTSDELNMAVDTEGMIRTRRRGFDALSLVCFTRGVIHDVKYWKSAGLYVAVSSSTVSAPPGSVHVHVYLMPETGRITTYTVQISATDLSKPSISFLRSKAVVSTGARPILLTKEPSGNYTLQFINLFIRDFRAYPDGLTVTERPETLSDEHHYNLLNSGWHQDRALLSTGLVANPITDFDNVRSKFPSNSDVPYLGDITDSNGDLKFDPKAYDNVNVGSTEAPRGHYVYSIRNIDRQSKITDKDNDGAPLSTLTTVIQDGIDVLTGLPVPGGFDPIDLGYLDTTPGVITP